MFCLGFISETPALSETETQHTCHVFALAFGAILFFFFFSPRGCVSLTSPPTARPFFPWRPTISSWRKEGSARCALPLLSSFLSKPWPYSSSLKTTWSLVWRQVSSSFSVQPWGIILLQWVFFSPSLFLFSGFANFSDSALYFLQHQGLESQ